MGFTTPVHILNDAFDQIERNPEEFTKKILDAIAQHRTDRTIVGVGNHGNPVEVLPSQHADAFRVLIVHHNSMIEVSHQGLTRLETTDEGRKRALLFLKEAKRLIEVERKRLTEVSP